MPYVNSGAVIGQNLGLSDVRQMRRRFASWTGGASPLLLPSSQWRVKALTPFKIVINHTFQAVRVSHRGSGISHTGEEHAESSFSPILPPAVSFPSSRQTQRVRHKQFAVAEPFWGGSSADRAAMRASLFSEGHSPPRPQLLR